MLSFVLVKRRLQRWLARRSGIVLVPAGCTLYVTDPHRQIDVVERIEYEEGATVVFGPPPEPLRGAYTPWGGPGSDGAARWHAEHGVVTEDFVGGEWMRRP